MTKKSRVEPIPTVGDEDTFLMPEPEPEPKKATITIQALNAIDVERLDSELATIVFDQSVIYTPDGVRQPTSNVGQVVRLRWEYARHLIASGVAHEKLES